MIYNKRVENWRVNHCPIFNVPLDGYDRCSYKLKEDFNYNAIITFDEDYGFLLYGALTSELRN